MKQPTFHGRVLLPLSVFAEARAGDPLAMERILRYYDGYINKLCTRTLYDLDGTPHVRVDEYPSDSFKFSAFGYDLHIRDELVAKAFASLSEQERQILILHCVAAMADGEIGCLIGMSKSAVQRHRTKTLKELRQRLEDNGGRNAK